jgi:type II secretory pathway component PulF
MGWRDRLSADVRTVIFGPPEERGGDGDHPWRGPIYLRRNRYWRDLQHVTNQIAAIVQVNASLPDGFDAATADAPSYPLKRLFAVMADDLDSGLSLYQSMARRDRFFPRFYVDLVRAGEETGRLAESMDAVRDIIRRTWDLRTRAGQYMAYIGTVWLALIFMSSFITLYLVPSFVDIMKDFAAAQPPALVAVRAIGPLGPLWVILAFALLVLLWRCFRYALDKSETLAGIWGRLMLRVPLVRETVAKRNLAHAAFTVSRFLRARVPLDEALDTTAELALNPVYRRALLRVSDRVRAGSNFKDAIEAERVFPASFAGFASLGEDSGRLPESLDRIEHLYRRQVARTERILLDVLSPLGILAAGAFVLLFYSAVVGTLAKMAYALI